MELTNEFQVDVPVERAWTVLTDVERIAPCLPGAQLQEIEGDEFRGVVKVKVGPITAQYKGVARFLEQDQAGGRLVLRAEGRDTRGQGNANATITATLTAAGSATRVSVVTDLTVTGKVAQFGRGVLADVSAKLLDQFVACLEADVLSTGDAAGAAADSNGTAPGVATVPTVSSAPAAAAVGATGVEGMEQVARQIPTRDVAPVDLMQVAGGSVAKRAVPVVGTVLVLLWIFTRRRRRK
ncbi:MAG TPA: SRPBCC family protein [Acidimicrobiales bacterium]|nr:SRPBCC family protein [Acidimicrobiales bacterium]